MNTKSIYLQILFLALVCSVWAQKPKSQNITTHDDRLLHFGFTVGLNTMDFKTVNSGEDGINNDNPYFADLYNFKPGFHVSMVSNLRLNEYMDLRFLPGISFGNRELKFMPSLPGNEIIDQNLTSAYLDFPLLVKYKAKRINNFRPYIIGGGTFRIDLASKKEYQDNSDEQIYLLLKPLDLYYDVGFGFDSYLPFFKLTTEFRYSIGLLNVKKDKEPQFDRAILAYQTIDKLFSRVFLISFYFE